MFEFESINWVLLEHAQAVQVGDLVSADAGGMPTYRVMRIQEDRAWLRDGDHDQDWVMPLTSFHWKAAI